MVVYTFAEGGASEYLGVWQPLVAVLGLPFAKKKGVSEQALGWLPLGLGLVMEDEPSELSCIPKAPWFFVW